MSTSTAMTPVIRFMGIGLTYPGPPEVPALLPCDLEIYPGEHVAVIGASGSGKSTLLNIAGLLDRPTSGIYELDGMDVNTLPEADRTSLRGRRIGFVFQAFHLLPYRTALENVALAQLYVGVSRSDRRRAAAEALDKVGLLHRQTAYPGMLSGGERQRVAVARALVNRPALLLCDEPTGNLDSVTAHSVLSLLHDLHRDGLTVILITHDPAIAAMAQRIIKIHDGRLSTL